MSASHNVSGIDFAVLIIISTTVAQHGKYDTLLEAQMVLTYVSSKLWQTPSCRVKLMGRDREEVSTWFDDVKEWTGLSLNEMRRKPEPGERIRLFIPNRLNSVSWHSRLKNYAIIN